MSNEQLIDQANTEICDLFAIYGSGSYEPTEDEKGILVSGVDLELRKLLYQAGVKVSDHDFEAVNVAPSTRLNGLERMGTPGGFASDPKPVVFSADRAQQPPTPLDVRHSWVSPQVTHDTPYGELYVVLQGALKHITALTEELNITDGLLKARDELIALIPECDAHGPDCLPHAADWIRAQQPKPDIHLSARDVQIDTFGKEGSVRLTHLESGFSVTVTCGRSQHHNKGLALKALQHHLKTVGGFE